MLSAHKFSSLSRLFTRALSALSMSLNADFSRRAIVHGASEPWVPSPMAGVERRKLDRIGDEKARATSFVRFAPGSHFSPHVHDGGEEYLVLDGVFQDDYGDFPQGTYVRNPPTSKHQPKTDPGCTIFVKLWQFDPNDRHQMRVDMGQTPTKTSAARPGVAILPLFANEEEDVRVETWDAGASINLDLAGGGEFLVMDGSFTESGDNLVKESWLRLPIGSALNAVAGANGAKVWVKTGHLRVIRRPPGVELN